MIQTTPLVDWINTHYEKHRDKARRIYWERKSMLPLAM